MSDEATPIAYTALLPGTPVHTSDGQPFGHVEQVLVDAPVNVFDGITVVCSDGSRFVDADLIGGIFTSHVVTTLTSEQATALPPPDQARALGAPPATKVGPSFGTRVRRMFGGR